MKGRSKNASGTSRGEVVVVVERKGQKVRELRWEMAIDLYRWWLKLAIEAREKAAGGPRETPYRKRVG